MMGAALTLAVALFAIAQITGLLGEPIHFGASAARPAFVESPSAPRASELPTAPPKTPKLQDVDWSSVEVGVECSECYGWCPNYRVTIDANGHVRYLGRTFVKTVGEATKDVPVEDVHALVQQFLAARFLDLDDDYSEWVSDLPSTWLELRVNGQRKRILNYWWAGAHDVHDVAIHTTLDVLAKSVDDAVAIETWIGTPEERETQRGNFDKGFPGRTDK